MRYLTQCFTVNRCHRNTVYYLFQNLLDSHQNWCLWWLLKYRIGTKSLHAILNLYDFPLWNKDNHTMEVNGLLQLCTEVKGHVIIMCIICLDLRKLPNWSAQVWDDVRGRKFFFIVEIFKILHSFLANFIQILHVVTVLTVD